MGVGGSSVCICQSCADGLVGTVVGSNHTSLELRCYTRHRSSFTSVDRSV